MQELLNLKNYKKALIIHHWDTDGLASAALFLRFFSKLNKDLKIDLLTPTINNYFLKESEYQSIEKNNYDFIITCDINFPKSVVLKLNEIKPDKVFVFDHHKQDPITEVFYHNKRYPSCTLVVAEYLQVEIDLLVSLGAIGDKEEKITQDENYWPIIEKVLTENDLDFIKSIKIRNLIDSCYVADDYKAIKEAVKLLQIDPLLILNDDNLKSNFKNTEVELDKMISKKADETILEKVLVFNINSDYNVLSHATRGLSKKYPDKLILSWQFKHGQTNIYLRRRDLDIDVSSLIDWARTKGCNSGGKEEVVGIIYQGEFKNIKDDLLKEVEKIIK